MKRYQLHYHRSNDPSESITISWEQGLQNFSAKYKGKEFYHSANVGGLNKGETVFHETLGNVWIRLCTRPIGFEVRVGDLFFEISRILAQEALGSVSAIWIFIGVISTLGSLGFAFLPGILNSSFGLIVMGVLFAFSIFYLADSSIVIIVMRVIVIGVVLSQFKNMMILNKHRAAKSKQKTLSSNENLLDNL